MPSGLSPAAMLAVVARHGQCERARDWEGALATMGGHPVYEIYPHRLRITSPSATQLLWEGQFLPGGPIRCMNESFILAGTMHSETYVNPDSVLTLGGWTFTTEDGSTQGVTYMARCQFEGKFICNEAVFLDAPMCSYFAPIFDESFLGLAGVEPF